MTWPICIPVSSDMILFLYCLSFYFSRLFFPGVVQGAGALPSGFGGWE
jgi:hypothetical protein